MNETVYQKLLSLVSPFIKKKDTIMRRAISPHERLTATLRFPATGRSYECLKFSTRISPQSLGKIIPETCNILYKVLGKYMQFPNSEEKWKEIATLFEERWHFPHCIGAMDGKHIEIIPPHNSGSYYHNYKGKHMVLLAIVDAKYQFLQVDFRTNGRISDCGVLQNTSFFEKLVNENLHISQPDDVSDNLKNVPYVFFADDAFPLRTNILKPFRQGLLDSAKKEVFNCRLSRARHIVENVFGILASRFRIFQSPINLEPENIEKVVMGTCALHNLLIEQQSNTYAPVNLMYQENNYDGSVISSGCDR
ncbi:uncharacterized protein LOC123510495 [Portunus trituberculatus]|uniref:uncharacterized protein LOC123510495 n=1 Tax=Portunus trituberculatus TaxID=210409 RepID=UPI001E1CBD3C|nr:uncharacterized protein LOC123510495 [Portunus trituberculatus]